MDSSDEVALQVASALKMDLRNYLSLLREANVSATKTLFSNKMITFFKESELHKFVFYCLVHDDLHTIFDIYI